MYVFLSDTLIPCQLKPKGRTQKIYFSLKDGSLRELPAIVLSSFSSASDGFKAQNNAHFPFPGVKQSHI